MTTAITMKVTLGALAGLLSYCENKKMKMAKIQAHVSNIAFLELNHPAFKHAKDLAEMADKDRTFKALAETIRFVIIAINCAIDAAHAEALEVDAVVETAVTKFKYGSDHFQAVINVKNESHSSIVNATASNGWKPRDTLRLIRRVWVLGDETGKAHRAAMAEMIANAPANGSIPGYEIPF